MGYLRRRWWQWHGARDWGGAGGRPKKLTATATAASTAATRTLRTRAHTYWYTHENERTKEPRTKR
jgi:hypothetical protein